MSMAGTGPALIVLGGWDEAGSSFPMAADLPSPLCLAAGLDRTAARRAGFLLGRAASGAGVDIVMGPRLDLATDPKARAGIMDLFGEEPRLAGRLGAAFIQGLRRGGAAACALSFPGCGSLSLDNRHEPPLLPFPAERLSSVEERPFARAIRGDLPAILVARAYVPAYDEGHIPAARSSLVIEGRLRSALGFRGIVIGDALEDDPEKPGKAAVLGALAGCDFSLARHPELALEAAAGLESAVKEGGIPAPRPAIQARRVEGLLAGLASPPLRARALPLYASPLVAAFSARTAEAGATVLRARKDWAWQGQYAWPAWPRGQSGQRGKRNRPEGRAGGAFVSASEDLSVLLFMPPSASGVARSRRRHEKKDGKVFGG